MSISAGSPAARTAMFGVLCVMGSATLFSFQDMLVKLLSDGYALHQITFIRSVVALAIMMAVFVPLDGGYSGLRTARWRVHALRGVLVVCANMSFYAGLAVLPLGEATAIYFFAPLVITALSAIALGEHVGPRRWAAVCVGFVGVLLVVQPGMASFQTASLLPLFSAVCYGSLQVLARYLGVAERPSTIAFYMQFTFLVFSAIVGISIGDGHLAGGGNGSVEFLTRAWIWPPAGDWPILIAIGCTVSIGAYLVSIAYSRSEAGLIAPFEYVAMPIAIVFAIVIWSDWPTPLAWAGTALIAGSGIFVFVREAMLGRRLTGKTPVRPVR